MKILTKLIYGISFAVMATAFVSCTSMCIVKRTNRLTDKMMTSLSEKNGNAFCLRSQYMLVSVVWTYYNGKIKIYKIGKWGIDSPIEYISSSPDINKMSGNENVEILPCIGMSGAFEHVGFFYIACLGYRMKRGDEVEVNTFPLDIDYFTGRKYESEFLNKIAGDIETYGIWENRFKR